MGHGIDKSDSSINAKTRSILGDSTGFCIQVSVLIRVPKDFLRSKSLAILLHQRQQRILDDVFQILQKRRSLGAVDDAVIAGERQFHD